MRPATSPAPAIRTADASFRIVKKVEQVINARFFTVDNGTKKGVAEGKRNTFLILAVPANYRQNMGHYLRVVRNIPLLLQIFVWYATVRRMRWASAPA